MKNVLVILFSALFLVSCATNKPDTVDIYNKSKYGIVLVVNKVSEDDGSIGTGFFIDENLIVTNYHVIENGIERKIKSFNSNKFYDIEVLSYSKKHDIALIKIVDWQSFINEQRYTVLKVLDSKFASIGEKVLAIGHPWGLDWSLSEGVISGKKRKINDYPVLFFQIDSKVYNGNSGGPLFDQYGNVIAVNSVIRVGDGGSYGFAIPSEYLNKVVYDLTFYQKSLVAKLGISITLTEDQKYLMVQEVYEDVSCDLKPNDIIRQIRTEKTGIFVDVIEFIDLIDVLYVLNMDQEIVKLNLTRDEKTIMVTCELNFRDE